MQVLQTGQDPARGGRAKDKLGQGPIRDAKGKELSERSMGYASTTEVEGNKDKIIAKELESSEQAPGSTYGSTAPPGLVDSEDVASHTCLLLDTDSAIRKACVLLSEHWLWEMFVFFCICYSTILLAMDCPWQPNSDVVMLINSSDPILLAVFTTEIVVKIMGFGFYGTSTSYLASSWNCLDFAAVVVSYITLLMTILPDGFGRVLRVCRAVRPLRMINKNPRIQLIFGALYLALPAICSVMFLASFFYLLFAVIGMIFFMSKFQRCNLEHGIIGRLDCVGVANLGEGFAQPLVWSNPPYSFDNVFEGMVTIFEVSTLQGWVAVMHSCVDITDVDLQPRQDASFLNVIVIVAAVFFNGFFILNIYAAVIIEKFNQISGAGMLTEAQKKFKDTCLFVTTQEIEPPKDNRRKGMRAVVYNTMRTQRFDGFMVMAISASLLQLSAEYAGQPQEYSDNIRVADILFVVLFTTEVLARLYSTGVVEYFQESWNTFDCGVVGANLVQFLLQYILGWNVQVLRPIRVLLIFRIVRRARRLTLMMTTLVSSMPAMLNVGALLLLLMLMYAIVGMQVFANVKYGKALGPYANFRSFGTSMLLLLRCLTGADWNVIMHDLSVQSPLCTDNAEERTGYWLPNDCGNQIFAMWFLISYLIVCTFTVMNLFVAVILDNFTYVSNVAGNEFGQKKLDHFKQSWFHVTLRDRDLLAYGGLYMKPHHLRDFVTSLGPPFGLSWDRPGRRCYRLIYEEVQQPHPEIRNLIVAVHCSRCAKRLSLSTKLSWRQSGTRCNCRRQSKWSYFLQGCFTILSSSNAIFFQ